MVRRAKSDSEQAVAGVGKATELEIDESTARVFHIWKRGERFGVLVLVLQDLGAIGSRPTVQFCPMVADNPENRSPDWRYKVERVLLWEEACRVFLVRHYRVLRTLKARASAATIRKAVEAEAGKLGVENNDGHVFAINDEGGAQIVCVERVETLGEFFASKEGL